MRIPRIYTSQPLATSQTLELEENPSRHIAKVLRMEAGRELVLFNGEGGEYNATLTEVGKKRVSVTLGEFNDIDRASPLKIELAIGVSRGERFEWVLQKATELGVTSITPLFTDRTEVKLAGPRLEKKIGHWQQILISACEQCQLNQPPTLNTPQQFTQWLPTAEADLKLVLHHRSEKRLADQSQPQSACLLIGPEGGLSTEEIQQAESLGFNALTLGPRVFRTETAPITAISLLQYLWGDLA
ncbi:16S rRNA (uracil(1498)-N(3))-methyltransferase [Maricurvus nonylphenolicus]|uniref:16S rRNA (uracil(1498)-N(3))-methyltransferase n=1 Tax=Maricurvus nonylphenolicus TaxID=1008307 RepID=UPI0036F2A2D9